MRSAIIYMLRCNLNQLQFILKKNKVNLKGFNWESLYCILTEFDRMIFFFIKLSQNETLDTWLELNWIHKLLNEQIPQSNQSQFIKTIKKNKRSSTFNRFTFSHFSPSEVSSATIILSLMLMKFFLFTILHLHPGL